MNLVASAGRCGIRLSGSSRDVFAAEILEALGVRWCGALRDLSFEALSYELLLQAHTMSTCGCVLWHLERISSRYSCPRRVNQPVIRCSVLSLPVMP